MKHPERPPVSSEVSSAVSSCPKSFPRQVQAVPAAPLLSAVPSLYTGKLQTPKSPLGPEPPPFNGRFGTGMGARGFRKGYI